MRKLTDIQVKVQTCHHDRAEVQRPGYSHRYSNGTETIKGKLKCPDCGFWWIDERVEAHR